MSTTGGILVFVGVVVMIGLVIVLSRKNVKNLSRGESEQASAVGLAPAQPEKLANLPFVWRRTDARRHAWSLCFGRHAGWEVRSFLFEHSTDVVSIGARTVTRMLASGFTSLMQLATHARTAPQRGVLLAVLYEGDPAKFKVRGRKLIGRDASAKQLLTRAGSVRLSRWTPPARIELREDWFFLHSLYIVPKWLSRYVIASTEVCTALASSEAIQPRLHSDLPPDPPL